MDKGFEPKIIVFCCNWCSYAGADLAGIYRLQMPACFRLIRVMCSGRVDPEFILAAFSKGADGVMVTGCHVGDCHYIDGNQTAQRRVALLKVLVSQYGLDPERLHLEWISAAEAQKFAETIRGFVDKIRELGPSPFGKERERTLDSPR